MNTPARTRRVSWRRSAGLPLPKPSAGPHGRWTALAGLTLVTSLLLLDDTAVAVALPAIQRRLGLGLSGLEWVVNAYTLTIAAFTLLAGRLGDRDGRRKIFLTGLAIFTLASLGAGMAPTGALLIAARAVQGLGAALVAPTSLAIIADTFPREERGLAPIHRDVGWGAGRSVRMPFCCRRIDLV